MSTRVAFIDSQVAGSAALAIQLGLDPSLTVYVLDSATDGLHQIALWLQANAGYQTVDIISNGAAARLQLGSVVLYGSNIALPDHANDLALIGAGLGSNGQINLYGSSVAADLATPGDGEGLVDQILASTLNETSHSTIAAVSASNDISGLGGNWALEYARIVGSPTLSAPLDLSTQGQFAGALTLNLNTPPALTGSAVTLPLGYENVTTQISVASLLQGWTDAENNPLSINLTTGLTYAGTNLATGATAGDVPGVATYDALSNSFLISLPPDFWGPVTLSYTVIDGQGGSSIATLDWSVAIDRPFIATDLAILPQAFDNAPYVVTNEQLVRGWDDYDHEPLGLHAEVFSVTHGTVTAGSSHTDTYGNVVVDYWTITPQAGYHGPVVIDYQVDDPDGGSTGTTLAFTQYVAAPPALTGTPAALPGGTEDTAYTVHAADLLSGFTDVNGLAISVANLSASHGTLVDNHDGTWTFTPAANYNGNVAFSYQVADSLGQLSPLTTETVAFAAVNDPPALTGSPFAFANGTEDIAYIVNSTQLLTGFTDVEGNPLTVGTVTADHGVVTANPNGTWTITPTLNYNGPLQLTYSVLDGQGGNTPATAAINLIAINDAPVAHNVAVSGAEDAVIAVTLSATDVDSTIAGYTIIGAPAHGSLYADAGLTVAVSAGQTVVNPTLYFKPDANWNGSTTLSFRANDGLLQSGTASADITVTPVNDAPIAPALVSQVIFAANDGLSGNEVWVSSGLTGGTHQLADLAVGAGSSNPSGFFSLGNGLTVFSADSQTGHGAELWVTDGTAAHQLSDLNPGAGSSSPDGFTLLANGRAIFSANGASGRELWVTDGTDGGTVQVKDLNPGGDGDPLGAVAIGGGRALFSAIDSGGRELWVTDGTFGGTSRVADLNPGAVGSDPTGLTVLPNGHVLFSANDGTNGSQLWVSDGTAAGTQVLAFITLDASNSNPADLTLLPNGQVVFAATDPVNGRELWVTDGTTAGTSLLMAIGGDLASGNPTGFTVMADGRAVFSAFDPVNGNELWITDGSAAGTLLLKNIAADTNVAAGSDPSGFVALANNHVVFAANDALTGNELWVTDGTSAGTVMLADINTGLNDSSPGNFVQIGNGQVLFSADNGVNGSELWVTDGTVAGTHLAADIQAGGPGSNPTGLAGISTGATAAAMPGGVEDTAYHFTTAQLLSGWTDIEGDTLSVSGTIGSEQGTVASLGGGQYVFTPNANYNGQVDLSFTVTDSHGGFTSGTRSLFLQSVNDLPTATGTVATLAAGIEDTAYTVSAAQLLQGWSDVESGTNLRVVDPTVDHGTVVDHQDGTWTITPDKDYNGAVALSYGVADAQGGVSTASLGFNLAPVNDAPVGPGAPNVVVFNGSDASHGAELWVTDGTTAGTHLLKDIDPAAGMYGNPYGFTSLGGGLTVFGASTVDAGTELWATDGTAAGTHLIKDIANVNPGDSSFPSTFTLIGGNRAVFVAADSLHTPQVWVTDGTAAGTSMISDVNVLTDSSWADEFVSLGNGMAIFRAVDAVHGLEPWITDGTAAGTHLLADVVPGATSSYSREFQPVAGGKLIFTATPDGMHDELWITDGTVAGTKMISTVSPVDDTGTYETFQPLTVGALAGQVIFSAIDAAHGAELWITDGTTAGTHLVKDINLDLGSSNPSAYFQTSNGTVLFQADDGVHGAELWKTDGTDLGTVMVADINVEPESAGSSPLEMIELGNHKVVFSATDGLLGRELYVTDASGTSVQLLADINPGLADSNPFGFTLLADGRAVFNADDGVHGSELWVTDGTAAGTQLLRDVAHGAVSGYPIEMAQVASHAPQAVLAAGQHNVAYTVSNADLVKGFTDVDGNALTAVGVTADHGNVAANLDGSFTVTPTLDFVGAVTLSYHVTDGLTAAANQPSGTETFTLGNAAAALTGPKAALATGLEDYAYTVSAADLLTGFTDINGDTLSVASLSSNHGIVTDNGNGTYTISAETHYLGPVSLNYQVLDGFGGVTAATQSYTLLNAPPVFLGAQALLADGPANVAYGLISGNKLLAGISDPNGNPLTISAITADHGTVSGDFTNGYTITPTHDFIGVETLNYTVSDGLGGTLAATQHFNLVNVAPSLTGTQAALPVGSINNAYTFQAADLTTGFSDVNGNALGVTGVSADLGTVVDHHDGSFTLTPGAGAELVTLSYTVTDGFGGSVGGTIGVSLQNDAPQFVGPAAPLVHGLEDTAYLLTAAALSSGFVDANGDALSIVSVNGGANGTAVDNLDGTWSFTGNLNYNGPAEISFVMQDIHGAQAAEQFQTIVLDPVNDAPIYDAGVITEPTVLTRQPFSFQVPMGTFTDVDSPTLTYTASLANGAALPAWLSFDAATQTFTGAPTDADAVVLGLTAGVASLALKITASDGALSTPGVFNIHVAVDTTYTGTNGDDVLTGTDVGSTFYGLDGNDALTGGAGADTMVGGAGNDVLDGGIGAANAMSGGTGDDAYYVWQAGDQVIENPGEGIDTVYTTVNGYTLGANVENLSLIGSSNRIGTGNELDNTIIGNGAINTLSGGAGNDIIDGGTGADKMSGGDGNDTYYVDNLNDTTTELSTGGTDTVISTVNNYTLNGNIEHLILSGSKALIGNGNTQDNVLEGSGLKNVLNGNAGNDTLYGYASDDTLDGGLGADTMYGGTGNDLYFVDNIGDVVVELASQGTSDTVNSSISYTLTANVERLTLTGTANLNGTGNALANSITGNSGNNRIDGGLGNDSLTGGAGNDQFVFSTALNGSANVDTISDFTIGQDQIVLNGSVFTHLNLTNSVLNAAEFHSGTGAALAATASFQHILYDTVTGKLYYDADGNGAGLAVQFATLNGVGLNALDASSFYVEGTSSALVLDPGTPLVLG
jgi:ELWxxDGT repeat protein